MEYRTLTQTQIIQSLGEALAWFEKELGWGVAPSELNHLTGRIGELYAAMITRGQMAPMTNQRGYDVLSAERERVSVKTVTSSSHVNFNQSTFHLVDRIIVLRINIEDGDVSIEEVFDSTIEDALPILRLRGGNYVLGLSGSIRKTKPLDTLNVINRIEIDDLEVLQYENGTISVEQDGELLQPAKPLLRKLAARFRVDILNGNGNPKNSRQLGADVILAGTEVLREPR